MIQLQSRKSGKIKRRSAFYSCVVLSLIGALVIFVLIAAGVFAALGRRLLT